ncbi:MAG: sensor histidine kinase, partial [Gammaproteobacteria bacterium]|nr:sensor histidine kinase [Gammaproteobacteria bacterium]
LVRVSSYEKQGHRVSLWLAEDMSAHYAPLQNYYLSFAIAAALFLLLLWWMQRYSLRRELSSLDQVADAIAQMKHGELERLSEQVPDEVVSLVREVNHLTTQLEKRIERSRHAIGNVAHALKTPMALLQQQAEDPLWQDYPQQHEQLQQQLRQINLRIDEELRRARIMGASHPAESFNPALHIPALIETIKRVHYERDVAMQCECIDQTIIGISRDDMLELLGNLLDNAYKWATGQVKCVIELTTTLKIRIEDDGPGTEQAELLMQSRGQRRDEQLSGHGLGLAICQEIVATYGGKMMLDKSPEWGGLRVYIELPL